MRFIDSKFHFLLISFIFFNLYSTVLSKESRESLGNTLQSSGDGSGDDEDRTSPMGSGDTDPPPASTRKVTSATTRRTTMKRPTLAPDSRAPRTSTTPKLKGSQMTQDTGPKPCNVRAERPYIPECDAYDNSLYKTVQCTGVAEEYSKSCFCVDRITGVSIAGTRYTSQTANTELQCNPQVFNITIGFDMVYDSQSMDHPSSHQYQALKTRIIFEISKLYNNAAGNQTVRLINFRRGSVIALVQVTSVGHVTTGLELARTLKSPVDMLIQSGKLDGMSLLPEHYKFQPKEGTASNEYNGIADSRDEAQQSGAGDNQLSPSDSSETSSGSAVEKSGIKKMKKLIEQPVVLGVIIAGGVALIVILILAILYCIYRVRKADEGSYALDEPKKAPLVNVYQRAPTREFYA